MIYSNPPAHGGLVVATILSNPELHAQWLGELTGMRERIKAMRVSLVEGLAGRGVKGDFSYIAEQRGMFSFSGYPMISLTGCEAIRVFMLSVVAGSTWPGLTKSNIDYVCDSIAEALKKGWKL